MSNSYPTPPPHPRSEEDPLQRRQDEPLEPYQPDWRENPAPGAAPTQPNAAVPPAAPNQTVPHVPVTLQRPRQRSAYEAPTQHNLPSSPLYQQPPAYPYQPPATPPGTPTRPMSARRQARTQQFARSGQSRHLVSCRNCLIGCSVIFASLLMSFIVIFYIIYDRASDRVQTSIEKLEREFDALEDPTNVSNFETTYIYDRRGNELYEVFGEGRRERIPLDQIPDYVIWATVAVEDDTFYENSGVDMVSILRSFRDYLREGEVVSGASTITQQLVRNVVFDAEYRAERSLERKIDEAILAIALTQRKSKDEIMELYLNQVYYGNLAYGIEAASQVHFGKPANQLQLHEAALLAGLPQLPAEYDPLNPDPTVQERVKNRQAIVLDLMAQEGYITQEQAEAAKVAPLVYVSPDIPLENAPHFVVYAQDEAERILLSLGYPPEFLANGGLRIYTTIDMDFQRIAEGAARTHIDALRAQHDVTNASVIAIHPPSGEIMAMVGSLDYYDESIDGKVNVSLAQRQPGSTMKAFTYSAALEQGWTPATIIWDSEVQIGIPGQAMYVPVNYDRRYHGPVRVRTALANSYNVPAVQTLRKVSVQYLLDFMQRFGVQSLNRGAENYGLSLTLGGGEITLMELTNGYATFARQGQYVTPTSILCIIDKSGNIIYQYEGRCIAGTLIDKSMNATVQPVPVLDPRIAFVISDILADNVARSPAMGSNSPLVTRDPNGNPLLTSVKTGTTDDFRDNWTVGYTHDLAVGVWTGNSDNRPMRNISGLQGAAPIWRDTMQGIYFNTSYQFPVPVIPQPPGLLRQEICRVETMRDPATDCARATEWFLDTPAMLPDGRGGLFQQPYNPPAQLPYSEFGPQITPVEPGIVTAFVRPLPPEQTALLSAQNGTTLTSPNYCLIPQEVLGSIPDATQLIFIEPPPVPEDWVGAYRYAAQVGSPILPPFACTTEALLAAAFAPPAEAWEVNPTQYVPWRTAAIYCLPDGSIEIYRIENSQGVPAFVAPIALINSIGVPVENALIAEGSGIRLYRLSSGQFQVNAPVGTDPNGYVEIWNSCSR